MSESYIKANGIRLAYEEFGSPSDPAIVLIMGLGTQMISWPLSLCNGLPLRVSYSLPVHTDEITRTSGGL